MIPGGQIFEFFILAKGNGLTAPPVTADVPPTAVLYHNGVATAEVVTITQQADLSYLATANIPLTWVAGDTLHLRVESTCCGDPHIAYSRLGHLADDLASIRAKLTQICDDAAAARKILCNRMEMVDLNTADAALIIYEDDGVTPFKTWPLSTFGGEFVQTCFGAQTERGVPT